MAEHPNQKLVSVRDEVGRPNVESCCKGSGTVLHDVVNAGCYADPQWRSEILYCRKAVQQLHDALLEREFLMS